MASGGGRGRQWLARRCRGGTGTAVRRGKGDPVQIGRGVAGSGGVKTALGATLGTAELNGVGEATGAGNGVVTIKRCPAGS
jgi:hypothetical protein